MTRLPWLMAGTLAGSLALGGTAGASQYRDAPQPVGIAVRAPGTAGQVIERCILAASTAYRLPPAMLVILLDVEGGRLGRVSGNTNATVDVGPMQVNEIWLPDLARHWNATTADSFLMLRDDFCANVEAGAWILRHGMDEARGDFWTGVGYYHSHDPAFKAAYLHKVLAQALRLQAAARARPAASAPPSAVLAANVPAPAPTPSRGF